MKEARDPTLARLEIAEAFKAQANAVAGSSEENDYWSAKGFPLWIEQAGDTAEIELISIISPITPFNLIWAPPAVPSIAYAESMPARNAAGRTVGMSSTVPHCAARKAGIKRRQELTRATGKNGGADERVPLKLFGT